MTEIHQFQAPDVGTKFSYDLGDGKVSTFRVESWAKPFQNKGLDQICADAPRSEFHSVIEDLLNTHSN